LLEQNQVEDLILENGWEYYTFYSESHDGKVRVVEVETDEPYYEDDGYYETGYPQGHEGKVFIVFEVDGRHWRKDGTNDSYGARSWDGKFREVTKGEILVTKYEWKEQ
jgi:hypothetical protein